jgi:hypothetical protein
LPPSVSVVGETLSANGGASWVTVGEPVVNGPSADVAFSRSLVIEVTCFLSASAMLSFSVTSALALGAMLSPDHVTRPWANVPPLSADRKLVLSGSGSVIVTPVASALPTFRSLIV